jgi:endonuclease/exonuclease/phosphatase (EEP) superfamily protein YafD
VGDTPILVGGDFNMPSDDSTMASLRSVLQFGFEEAGWGYGYTRPTRYPWLRIDHILASHHWRFTECRVGPDFHSDHLPLIAEAVLPANSSPPTGAPGR